MKIEIMLTPTHVWSDVEDGVKVGHEYVACIPTLLLRDEMSHVASKIAKCTQPISRQVWHAVH